MTKHAANTSSNAITLEILEPASQGVTYAVYLYDDRGLCLIKRKYQSSNIFSFDNLPKGAYKARIYIRNNTKILSSWNTELLRVTQPLKDDVAQSIVNDIIQGHDAKTRILSLFDLYPAYLSQALSAFRVAFQGSRITQKALEVIAKAMLEVSQERNLVPAQVAFSLNLIAMVSPPEFLKSNEMEISAYALSAENIPDFEKHFCLGLIQYRIGNYFSAEKAFQSISAEDEVRYHQSGARSYLSGWGSVNSSTFVGHSFQLIRKITANTTGVILISCDYGYFKSYFKTTLERIQAIKSALHVHIILPDEIDIQELEGLSQLENLGISYERESADVRQQKNRKTYYSVARYLVCAMVLDLYKKPVLVADIDIDFDRPIDEAFRSIGDDEIALYFGK